jgi:hypothetical protein
MQGKAKEGVQESGVCMMNRCAHFKKHISRYIDNDLDESGRKSVENNVASCQRCQEVIDSYVLMKKLISECYAFSRDEAGAGVQRRIHTGSSRYFPVWSLGIRIAAVIVLAVLFFTGFYLYAYSKRNQQMPVVMEGESRSVLNTPLCALVYYEELAGKTIHSQYARIHDNPVSSYDNATSEWISSSCYKSPLFYDNSIVEQKYEAIKNMAMFQQGHF